jgi:hypothetical protein
MGPDADTCARCGYAVPLDRDRCLACGRRIRRRAPSGKGPAPVAPTGTGAAAADAWAAWSATVPERSPGPELGDLSRYRDTTPLAVRLVESLRLARLAFAALGVVALARLGFALAAEDAAELADLGWWDTLEDTAKVLAVVTGATLLLVASCGLLWAQPAIANLRTLALRLHPPPGRRFRHVALVAAAAVAGGTWAWRDHPLAEERTTALVVLAVAAVGFALTTSVRPAIAAITLVERQRAELIARIEAAGGRSGATRPR